MGSANQPVPVTFKVMPHYLPPGSRIFITGNHPQLGYWNPGAVPLKLQSDGSWLATFYFSKGTVLEYKITRGDWENEALTRFGTVPGNSYLKVTRAKTVVVRIPFWKDTGRVGKVKIVGMVEYHRGLKGERIVPRDVIVWLPPNYHKHSEKRFPVLYVHDGQNMFDPNTAFTGVDWRLDETAVHLINQKRLQEIIIVAIYNTADRDQEYSLSPSGKAYRDFIIHQLKPFIDNQYRTRPEREFTASLGSSMGGLVSFILAWEHPDVFSGAACMSPSFIFNGGKVLLWVKENPAPSLPLRFFLDVGCEGETQLYRGARRMFNLLLEKGFSAGHNLEWFYDETGSHTEHSWGKRVWRPLIFLFGRQ